MSSMNAVAKQSFGKRVVSAIVVALVTIGLLELVVFLVFRPSMPGVEDEIPVAAVDSAAVRSSRERAGLGFRDPLMTLHPYLGYVFLPKDKRSPANPGHPAIAVSEDGFLDTQPAVRKRRPDRVIIGITGGSVSGQFGTWHAHHLATALQGLEAFQRRELEFVWLGMPGYHQPQQTIQLAYILAQGGEFDYLINLDGFNELAVPAALNAPQGAHPLYPMNWSMVALDVPDAELRRTIGAIDYLRSERRTRNAAFAVSPWRVSPTFRWLHQRGDARLVAQLAAYAWQLQSHSLDEIPYFVSGPERLHVPLDDMVPELVAIWSRTSRQMNAMCTAFGIRYLHCLQPNQYDPGSKPLSRKEKEAAYEAESPYRQVIEKGYPQLRAAGSELRQAGIAFHDLSRVFETSSATLYKDNCCHFNSEGNRILAEAIARAVETSY